jgi:hypothetical protein
MVKMMELLNELFFVTFFIQDERFRALTTGAVT